LDGALVAAPDHHAIGLHEVVEGVAFLEELGVGGDGELVLRLLADDRLDLVAGAHGDGRLGDHHRPAGQRVGDVSGGLRMYDRSADPSGPGGVPTASSTTSAPATPP